MPVGRDVPAAVTRTVAVVCFVVDFSARVVALVEVTRCVTDPADVDPDAAPMLAVTRTPSDFPKADAGTTKVLAVAPETATPLTTQRYPKDRSLVGTLQVPVVAVTVRPTTAEPDTVGAEIDVTAEEPFASVTVCSADAADPAA